MLLVLYIYYLNKNLKCFHSQYSQQACFMFYVTAFIMNE